MSQLNEIYDNERIEKDTFRSMRELTKYSKILSKGNNLFIIIKKNLHLLKLISAKSLFKISMLLDSLPEENVSFTFYTEEKIENQNNKNSIKQKKNSYKKNNEVNNIYIIDNVDNNLAEGIYKNGKGNIIGYNYNLFKCIWKYIYLISLIVSIIFFILFSIYSLFALIKEKYYILFGNISTLFNLCLLIFTCYSGYKKLNTKKKVTFKNENILLIIFIHLDLLCMILWIYIYNKEKEGFELSVLLIIDIILILLDISSIILLYLNIKIFEFCKEYSDLYDEGIPLIDV